MIDDGWVLIDSGSELWAMESLVNIDFVDGIVLCSAIEAGHIRSIVMSRRLVVCWWWMGGLDLRKEQDKNGRRRMADVGRGWEAQRNRIVLFLEGMDGSRLNE